MKCHTLIILEACLKSLENFSPLVKSALNLNTNRHRDNNEDLRSIYRWRELAFSVISVGNVSVNFTSTTNRDTFPEAKQWALDIE